MLRYYEDKMNNSHKQWQEAASTDKPIAAEMHRKDYLNYKELYERRLELCGGGNGIVEGER